MNMTQKRAWYHVGIISLVLAAVVFYLIVEIGLKYKLPESFWKYIWFPASMFITGIGISFLCIKYNTGEPWADERDKLIKLRAMLAAFISVIIALFGTSVIPIYILGRDGMLPVSFLPKINFCVLCLVLFVYSVAVLIQYGRGAKDGK
ncbi:MAG: hypothetical protein JW787_00085 [Sedimentisphaerales bacterium]|nr:hypothetical protein [Sedimentisphaerales bacterium]